ncbi:hypothetical protein H6P81_006198 [Aristolochia fimbriata]|uniref:Uncharacterized protein n=1 Tax=Aristolochia fimbriata TaxID=158543 RepID=A0AAV7EY09_ARIFI|nr:hypothetical protein H6P81_006198 [Aristolochia fimbriata]
MGKESENICDIKGVPTRDGSYVEYYVLGNLFEVTSKYVPPIHPVGRGAYGIVCCVKNVETDEEVAIKKIGNAFDNRIDAKRTLREIKLLIHMDHELFRSGVAVCFVTARMVRVSVLNDALKSMYNAEKRGKRQVMIRPSSKVVIKFLLVMQKHGYIGEFEWVDDHRAGKIVVELNGRLNKCGVISPRFDVGVKEIESWTARLLPQTVWVHCVDHFCWDYGP